MLALVSWQTWMLIVLHLSRQPFQRYRQRRTWRISGDSHVDAVIIATPVHTHFTLAKEALLHGKHVLVEKPLTTNVAQAEELIALATKQQLVLAVGHTFLYNPAVEELRRMILAGDLGKIYCVEAERVNLGLYRSDTNVIWDLAPHDISILLYLFEKKPEQMKVQAHAHLQSMIHDIAHLDFGYADGMTAHIHLSWLHPCKIRSVTVIGDARMAVYDDTNPSEMIKVYNKGADVDVDPVVSYRFGEIIIPHIDWIEPLHLECEDFAHSIRTGTKPRASGEVGLEVVKVLAQVQEELQKQSLQQSYEHHDRLIEKKDLHLSRNDKEQYVCHMNGASF